MPQTASCDACPSLMHIQKRLFLDVRGQPSAIRCQQKLGKKGASSRGDPASDESAPAHFERSVKGEKRWITKYPKICA
jgi:hypothetical protein